MKYNDFTLGQVEAVFNKLGGTEGVANFLSGKTMVVKIPSDEKISFNVWKTIKLGTYHNVEALRNSIRSDGNINISDWANDILGKPAFTVALAEEEIQLVNLSVADLGFKSGATYGNICAKAKELSLELCPNEVGPQLRLQYKDQPKGEYLRIAMEPIAGLDGRLCVFYVEHGEGGLWLRGSYGDSDHFWDASSRFVFRLRNSLHFSPIINNTRFCLVLKCDIKKFFASIDHNVLKSILTKHIKDKDIIWLLNNIIDSFHSKHIYAMADICKTGLPLGNLTSQLLVNIYMNEFDQYVKHKLKVKYYIRYADDFVVLSQDKRYLENTLKQMKEFLEDNLKLIMHPNKVFIKTISSGVDFLGWVHFPKHRVLRTSTKKRMFRNIKNNQKPNTIPSYLGMLSHGNGYKLKGKIISL